MKRTTTTETGTRPATGWELDPNEYDHVLIMFSGGKDSLASILHVLEAGVPAEKIELWHHSIDGAEGSDLMDWGVTPDYCRKVADALDLPIYFSWRTGGFEGEMMREDAKPNTVKFETPGGGCEECGGRRGGADTRRKFPQMTGDLNRRWCSAYLKIAVGAMAITNQPRFDGKRTLVITGERAEESKQRARYKVVEADRADNRDGKKKRHVTRWRPVHGWTEAEVWAIIERHKVNPHPCYKLGWGRCSCEACIFGSRNQWATIEKIDPEKFDRIAKLEVDHREYWEGRCPKCDGAIVDGECSDSECGGKEFGGTIRRKESIREAAAKGDAYAIADENEIDVALGREYRDPVIVDEWTLPAGAFGESDTRL